ncbi:unnamed protein product [marine sediment metagenome]|uniref:Uncharacterized protein n=1 Tax=marine sediment metagenome TaxID=412755 RepID=X1B5B4_9ZZZZ
MSILEAFASTWEKRFMQRHYSYRDSHAVLTGFDPTVATASYTFGTNARTNVPLGSIFRWPNAGDYASGTTDPRGQCYARSVMVYVVEDTWLRFISLNPIYGTLIAQGYTAEQIVVMGVPITITEVEHFLAAGDKDTFYLTYGVAIGFRAATALGMIYISIEGNVEGGE